MVSRHFIYQTHCVFLEEDICQAVRCFWKESQSQKVSVIQWLCSFPKLQGQKILKNFRPISLCNVLYKIASKVLANHLKVFLPVLISDYQSAFVPSRLITNNTLIAFECLHTIRGQRSKQPFFSLKIDIMKAYDRVEWSYLHAFLTKLGFAPAWIDSVMRCVTTVRYAVRVNGELT